MVAQRKTHTRCKALIYLIGLLLIGCSEPKTTIIEFESIDPIKLSGLLERYSNEEIQYDIIDNRIIFHSDEKSIANLIDLLKELDSQTNNFLLTFSWGQQKRYSTITLPNPISLATNLETPLTLFSKPTVLKLTPISNNRYSLNITLLNSPQKQSGQQIESISTPNQINLKLTTQQNPTEEFYQVVLSEGVITKLGNATLPKGLHILLEKL